VATLLENDPVDLLLDADNDIVVTDDLQFSRGLTAVAQGIRIRMQLFKGEWFLNLNAGIPYLERPGVTRDEALIGQKFNELRARAVFRKAILTTPGVLGIEKLDVKFNDATRKLSVTWVARTVFGDTDPDTLDREI
jgi:hypothetical protein